MTSRELDPAFPSESFPDRDGDSTKFFGLSKREHFAGLAMQGFCANSDLSAVASEKGKTPGEVRAAYAKAAVQLADLLLAELEKP